MGTEDIPWGRNRTVRESDVLARSGPTRPAQGLGDNVQASTIKNIGYVGSATLAGGGIASLSVLASDDSRHVTSAAVAAGAGVAGTFGMAALARHASDGARLNALPAVLGSVAIAGAAVAMITD